jgi:multiple RNA-binding domain-containing protein 1
MTTPGSSRIIVKNIGKNMTENSLRDTFNQKGEVTDVRIQKTKSGKSREFAFIGYRTEQQALEAQKYFNNTFLQTSRITVDLAKSIHDPLLLMNSKSRYTKNKLIKQKSLLKKEEDKSREEEKKKQRQEQLRQKSRGGESQERAKAEFLSVMKSRSQANVWGNDDVHIHLAQEKQQKQFEHDDEASEKEVDDSESDSSDYNEAKVTSLSTKTKTGKDFHDLGSDSDSADESGSEDGIVKGKATSTKSSLSDLDFLRGKVKKNITEDSDSDDESDEEVEKDESEEEEEEDDRPKTKRKKVAEPESEEEDVDNAPQAIEENEEDEGRLFIRNLPYSVSEEELTELFTRYGPLSQV